MISAGLLAQYSSCAQLDAQLQTGRDMLKVNFISLQVVRDRVIEAAIKKLWTERLQV